jgi:hypothetical protein
MPGKKRKPLRSYKQKERKVKRVDACTTIATHGSSKRQDIDEDWERIEKQAFRNENGDDSDENSSNSDDTDEIINLVGDVEQSSEQYNFEFNDMRAEYSASIRTLLRSLIKNPSEAYQVADCIVEQGIVAYKLDKEELTRSKLFLLAFRIGWNRCNVRRRS